MRAIRSANSVQYPVGHCAGAVGDRLYRTRFMLVGMAFFPLMFQVPAARAEISLDPELYLARCFSGVNGSALPVGRYTQWIDHDDFDPLGGFIDVSDNRPGWEVDVTALANYGLYQLSGRTKLSNSAYSFAHMSAVAETREYMVLSPIVPGTTTITNIARFGFVIHGNVPEFWIDSKTFVERCLLWVRIRVDSNDHPGSWQEGSYAEEWIDFNSPVGTFMKYINGQFTFDIDEVITIRTEAVLEMSIRPLRPDPEPEDWYNLQREIGCNATIDLRFDSTIAWVGLDLPEGIKVAATASGATYPVNYTVPGIPEPAGLSLLAAGSLLMVRRRGGVSILRCP